MTNVSRQYAVQDELRPVIPDESLWLSPAERVELARLRDAKRRTAWLCGRWLAKQMLAEHGLHESQILSINDRGRPDRPRILIGQEQLSWSVSISHTDRGVLVALCTDDRFSVGVDLVPDKPIRDGLLQMWFTERERTELGSGVQNSDLRRSTLSIMDERNRRKSEFCTPDPNPVQTLWAIKEAVYKASNTGEPFAPRRFEVRPGDANRYECYYRGERLDRCRVSQWNVDGHVAVLAVCDNSHVRQKTEGIMESTHAKNPKSEYRNPKQIQIPNDQIKREANRVEHLNF